jgi:hypothetical protein
METMGFNDRGFPKNHSCSSPPARHNLPASAHSTSNIGLDAERPVISMLHLSCANKGLIKLQGHYAHHILPCISYYPQDRPGTATTTTNTARFFSKPSHHPAGSTLASISRFRALSHRAPSNLLEGLTGIGSRKCVSIIEVKINL